MHIALQSQLRLHVFSPCCFAVLLVFLGFSTPTMADYSTPVTHTHNGREHTHQLPKEGIAHRHGIGQLGKPVSKKPNKVIYSSATNVPNKQITSSSVQQVDTLHSHNGRQHRHTLPKEGIAHRHGNGALGKPVGKHAVTVSPTVQSGGVIHHDASDFPILNPQNKYNQQPQNQHSHNHWSTARGLNKFVKGDTRCASGQNDCNVCAANVQQQFQQAANQQLNWQRKSWSFVWPQSYPPRNVRPFDVFDGDPKYALGIPDTHVQGFVRTNSDVYPYAGSHSHKRKGGIFVLQRMRDGSLSLSSLQQTTGRHPSGVQIIGKYLVYGEGTRLFFKDINSRHHSKTFQLSAQGANFGGGLGVIKLAVNQYLLVTTGPGGQKPGLRVNRFYHLQMRGERPSSLRFVSDSTTKKPNGWPTKFGYSENLSLITECGTGDIYAVHTTGDQSGISAISGNGYWRLSKLVTNGKALGLRAVNAFTTGQDMKRCNVRASATVSVNPQNRLEFACHAYAKDPDGSGFNVLGKSTRNRDRFYFNVGVVR